MGIKGKRVLLECDNCKAGYEKDDVNETPLQEITVFRQVKLPSNYDWNERQITNKTMMYEYELYVNITVERVMGMWDYLRTAKVTLCPKCQELLLQQVLKAAGDK